MDIKKIENVHLPTLEMRRIMTDLTTCCKLLNSLILILLTLLLLQLTQTHRLEEIAVGYRKTIGPTLNICAANMFHNRVINFWNKLPDSVVLATSISSFKWQLSIFVINVGPEYFFLGIVICCFY